MMQAKANFWIEKDGKVALSSWRVRLLEAVGETGSISAAASRMGVSYRRAWDKIHECEERLGVKLIDTQTGGSGGGGSQLTPVAVDYIERFHQFAAGLNEAVANRFQEFFSKDQSG
ncbi:MAG: LysR family transcriptional regulator [Anaerolineae bacterium]|nr:LysR family transcriptional regulator [Anaerolineae bacterium]